MQRPCRPCDPVQDERRQDRRPSPDWSEPRPRQKRPRIDLGHRMLDCFDDRLRNFIGSTQCRRRRNLDTALVRALETPLVMHALIALARLADPGGADGARRVLDDVRGPDTIRLWAYALPAQWLLAGLGESQDPTMAREACKVYARNATASRRRTATTRTRRASRRSARSTRTLRVRPTIRAV